MLVSTLQEIFGVANVAEDHGGFKKDYIKNAEKPFRYYLTEVSKKTPNTESVESVYKNVKHMYEAMIANDLAPTTIRNYMRWLRETLNVIPEVKALYTAENLHEVEKSLNDVIKDADKVANKYNADKRKKKKADQGVTVVKVENTPPESDISTEEVEEMIEEDANDEEIKDENGPKLDMDDEVIETLAPPVSAATKYEVNWKERYMLLEHRCAMLEMKNKMLEDTNERLWKLVEKK